MRCCSAICSFDGVIKYIQPKRMAAMRRKPIRVLLLFISILILQNRAQKYEKKCPAGHFFNESFSVADDFNNKVNAST